MAENSATVNLNVEDAIAPVPPTLFGGFVEHSVTDVTSASCCSSHTPRPEQGDDATRRKEHHVRAKGTTGRPPLRRSARLGLAFVLMGAVLLSGDAWSSPAKAVITLDPTYGPPTTDVNVSGAGFGAKEHIVIRFDLNKVGKSVTDGSGSFSATIAVPASATPKKHLIKAIGSTSSSKAIAPFLVRTDWARFRDDLNGSGVNPYENTLDPSNVSGLQVAWSSPTSGGIDSSPAVADGLVFVGSADGSVYARNATTGASVWSYPTGGGVSSSPAVVNGIVYVGANDGKVYALDAITGSLEWSHGTGGVVYSSPVVTAGIVYAASEDGTLYALSAATGKVKWSYPTGDGMDSSPAVVDGVVYVGSWDDNVYALSASTGALVWSYTTGGGVSSSPAVANGTVFVGSDDGYVYALSAATGSVTWSYRVGGVGELSPAVDDGVVFVGGWSYSKAPAYGHAKLYALDASTGAPKWVQKFGSGPAYSSPAVANGVVYIGRLDGTVLALDAATGDTDWSYLTGGDVYSSPAIADGTVYVGSYSGVLYAFGLR